MSSTRHLRTDGQALDSATTAVVDAIDLLAVSIVPTVDPPVLADSVVTWALPNRAVIVELRVVDRAEAFGVRTVSVPAQLPTEAPFSRQIRTVADVDVDLGAAIRQRITHLPAAPPRRRRLDLTAFGGQFRQLQQLIDGVEYLLFVAPAWQRLATLAVIAWIAIGAVAGNAATALARGVPGLAPAVGGQVGFLVGLAGWLVTARWLAGRFPANDAQRAAQFDTLRQNTLSFGCLGMFAWVGVAALIGVTIAELLTALGAGAVMPNVLLLGLLVAGFGGSVWTIRQLRRRYPPPPQTVLERWVGRLLPIGLVVGLGAIAWFGATSHATVRADQVAWCLGPGAGALERSIATSPVERTWTAATAATDPNFASACSLAWDATH